MKAIITAFTLISCLAMALRSDEVVESHEPTGAELWSEYQELTIDDFENIVSKDEENVWAVAFMIDTCHMCHELAPVWGQLQIADTIGLRKIKFGYVNLDSDDAESIVDNYTGEI